MPIKVWFTNFGYYAERTFDTIEQALAYAKQHCFEVTFDQGTANGKIRMLGAWSPIGGFRDWR